LLVGAEQRDVSRRRHAFILLFWVYPRRLSCL
jgi:hypothetical protein